MTSILYTDTFKKNYKALSKKYPSLKDELAVLIAEFQKDPRIGTPLGHDAFKIRLAVKSKGRGKSGGLRLITFVQLIGDVLYLLSLYDKADLFTVSDKELKDFIKTVRTQSV